MKYVHPLKQGDTIGIAAPASPFDRTKFTKGVRALENLGFKVFYRGDIFDQSRYLAGTDKRRADEFLELTSSRNISAIMFARGGYGSQRIIPMLDEKILREHPKPVIGFSDITALLNYLRQTCGTPTFYGPVLTQLGTIKEQDTFDGLLRALTTSGPLGDVSTPSLKVVKEGRAKGPIVGGCLTLINSSIGTPYELKTDNSILFIEEVNEKVYVIDRMLTQLNNSGLLGRTAGIIFGSIIPHKEEPYDPWPTIFEVLKDFKGPIVKGFPAGHIDNFTTIQMGAEMEIDATNPDVPRLTYTSGLFS